MKILPTLNDVRYDGERTYNDVRLADALAWQEAMEFRMFLIRDAASAAHKSQKFSNGYASLKSRSAPPQLIAAPSKFSAPAWLHLALQTKSSKSARTTAASMNSLS